MSKNPRRVEAGRRNRALRGALTNAGLDQLRQSIKVHQPWLKSTGPKSAEGKRKVSQNSRKHPEPSVDLAMSLEYLANLRELRLSNWLAE